MVIIQAASPSTLPKEPPKTDPAPTTPSTPTKEPTPLVPFEPGPAQPDRSPNIDPDREHEECKRWSDLKMPRILPK
jgi:hypothetical protein